MNAATHAVDLPQDLAHLTERCMRRLFERLEHVLDASANLDNPKNITASLRAVSLLLRLCTSIRNRPASTPRHVTPDESTPAPQPEPTLDDAATRLAQPGYIDDHASPITEPAAAPAAAHAAMLPTTYSTPARRRPAPPSAAAALAARAGYALGPAP